MLYLFPFEKVKKDSTIIIYGHGTVGKSFLQQIRYTNYCNVLFAVDKNHHRITEFVGGVDVLSPEKILTAEYDYIVVAVSLAYYQNVLDDIVKMNIPANKIIYKDPYCHQLVTSYSAAGEDLVILEIFKALGIEKPGYIDVGAHHPYFGSNTALLYKHGSRGICIEANPDFISAFHRERPDDINLNLGVAAKKGILPFYNVVDLWTFSHDVALSWIESHPGLDYKIREVKKIPVTTLSEIIEQYSKKEGYPDFMTIDIDGLDYEVLESCDFARGKPSVICAELCTSVVKMNDMLSSKGFVPYCKMGYNMIYIRDNLREKILGAGI